MPFAKCRHYTESGEPVKGGCHRKDAGCAFIHPDEPNWGKARSSKPRDKSGDSGGFKSRGERSNPYAPATPVASGRDTGGGWGSANGWGSGSGWGAEDATTTSNPDTESAWSTTKTWDTSSTWGHADAAATSSGVVKSTENGWGESSDKATGSGWGNTSDGTSGWGNANDADKATGSGWGSVGDGTSRASGWGNTEKADKATPSGWGGAGDGTSGAPGWGNTDNADKATPSGWGGAGDGTSGASGWGNVKNADKDVGSGWGSTQNGGGEGGWGNADKDAGAAWKDGWSASWGINKDASNSMDASDAMIVDKPAEQDASRKAKRKTVPPPPRIRIPDNEHKERKMTGSNNEPLATIRWGSSRTSNHTVAPTPATISTPITVVTPTDSTRIKRKHNVAFDDKADAFKEYIKSWERGVRARFMLAEAEAKRDRWFRTQKSACYARIGEAGRKKLDGQRAECDQEVAAQREKLSAAITSLVEFHDTFSSSLELGQRYNVDEEAQKFVQESRGFVDEARALLVTQVLKDNNDARMEDIQKLPSEANSSSIDTLRGQFRDLEERLEQAQTELTLRRPRTIRSEIDELLTAKIANLRVARQREIDHAASRPGIVIPPAALTKIEQTAQHVRELDAKVPQAVEDIRVLLLRVDATTRRVKELEEELSTSKETYRKMQCMIAEKETVDRQADEQMGKIQDQFEQLILSQPPGVVTPQTLSPTNHDSRDKLMESIQPAFEATLDKFYKREVQPTIDLMQRNIVDASDRFQAEAIQVLWGRIKPAMNMVAEVSRWLDSQELEHTAPVAVEELRALGRNS